MLDVLKTKKLENENERIDIQKDLLVCNKLMFELRNYYRRSLKSGSKHNGYKYWVMNGLNYFRNYKLSNYLWKTKRRLKSLQIKKDDFYKSLEDIKNIISSLKENKNQIKNLNLYLKNLESSYEKITSLFEDEYLNSLKDKKINEDLEE
jgi:hypothetical protein